MQEKDMKKRLDQELSEVAPDILQNILAQPRVPITDEKELLGDDAPLFKEKKVIRPFAWVSAVAAVVALIVVVSAFVHMNEKTMDPDLQQATPQMAYSILIDVNPSIEIKIGKDGTVEKVKARNDDAKKIVKKVNKKLGENASYEEAMKLVVHQLNKKYLKKKGSAMLVSIASEDEKAIKGKTKEIKKATDTIKKEENVKCKTLYQKCVVTDKVKKVSEKNDVSYGKAALCIKIADKKDEKVSKLCKKKIPELLKKAKKTGVIDEEDEIEYEDCDYEGMELETEETSEWDEEMESTEWYIEESTEEEIPTEGFEDDYEYNEDVSEGSGDEVVAPEPADAQEPESNEN